jgi:ABC-type bacteriocin/lantibiotic exporter with double-glycine peptidase domain
LHDLEEAAQQLGLRTAALRWKDKQRARFDCPAILHVRSRATLTACDHFVTCFGERDNLLCIADYPKAPAMVPRERVLEHWDGDALYLDDARGDRLAKLLANPLRSAVGLGVGTLVLAIKRRQRPKLKSKPAALGPPASQAATETSF